MLAELYFTFVTIFLCVYKNDIFLILKRVVDLKENLKKIFLR